MQGQDLATHCLSDPVRLKLLNTAFGSTQLELERRMGRSHDERQPGQGAVHDELGVELVVAREAARIARALTAHVKALSSHQLELLHKRLAVNLLREIDRRMAGPGTSPGGHLDLATLMNACLPDANEHPRPVAQPVGLLSLPWMSPAMPSIQLATLAAVLREDGIESDVYELYVDYAAQIGLNLYSNLSNLLGFLPEWVFSRHYYRPESGDDLGGMIAQSPLSDIPSSEFGDSILHALEPVTKDYIDGLMAGIDFSRYDVLGFSLTISQLGASMAVARRVKLAYPSVRIVFGGSQCAGSMGRAILRICPYVDVVVHVEGELVFPELVRRLRASESPAGLPGVSYRATGGEIVSSTETHLHRPSHTKPALDYDPYFRRLIRLGLLSKVNPWLPFESSRGCWYGQKVQCTFCGLHEIMEFRAWEAGPVLDELERLANRYRIFRFYSMDLMMPREYLRTLLPEIVRRGHDWMFFYEVKANLRRHELELMATAGVRWVQPGIESLDASLLQLMRKGVLPHQNIVLLKWSEELGISCGWNLLFGLPNETQESYTRMADLIPRLSHLRPPSGGGKFQLHRFSPYFDHPDKYGIRWTGAHPMFRYAFPCSREDLDELVYLHEFVPLVGAEDGRAVETAEVEAAVGKWQAAYRSGATLGITAHADGHGLVVDHRDVSRSPIEHRLSPAETKLYLYLDGGVSHKSLGRRLVADQPLLMEALGGEPGVGEVIDHWLRNGLVVSVDGKVVALALNTARITPAAARQHRYLDNEGE